MDYYGLIGNPVHHSLSPLVHKLFAEQTDQQMVYQLILVALDQLEQAVADFQTKGGMGVNITLPFKARAFSLVDEHSDRSLIAKAVNTILFHQDGSRYGDNTDGAGLVRDILNNLGISIRDKHILILGAGGAVHGIISPLLAEQPQQLVVTNRTESKAIDLVNSFANLGPVIAKTIAQLTDYQFDIIINGTSASLNAEMQDLPKKILAKNAYCYDMVYGKGLTPFLRWAKELGAGFTDGLGMLVEQAAESFYLWRKIKPNTQPVLATLRENTSLVI